MIGASTVALLIAQFSLWIDVVNYDLKSKKYHTIVKYWYVLRNKGFQIFVLEVIFHRYFKKQPVSFRIIEIFPIVL